MGKDIRECRMSEENTEFLLLDIEYGSGFDNYLEREGYAHGPERALMLALLFDAVQLLLAGRTLNRTTDTLAFREAQSWLMSDDHDYVFSFRNVCEALGINSAYLRLGILNAFHTRQFRQMRKRD